MRSQRSVTGVNVIVKSLWGSSLLAALKTFVSMPMLLSAIVDLSDRGPNRIVASASGSGVDVDSGGT